MATYSMTLRETLQTLMMYKNIDYSMMNTKDFIEEGRKHLFDFEYSIFDEAYRKVFETHFIRRFYMREIGFESDDLFKFQLETWLMIHMPFFNKLFQSELLTFDPLVNNDLKITDSKTRTSDNTQTSNTKGTNDSTNTQNTTGTLDETNFDRQLTSNTPDNRLAITTQDGSGVIEYASKIDENSEKNTKTSNSDVTGSATDTTDVTSSGTSTVNETEDFLQSRVGKTGDKSTSKLLMEYRESFLRIERDMFKEMSKELFMLVY